MGIATDKSDNIYVLDGGYVLKFTSDAQLVTKWHIEGQVSDYDISIDGDGNAYVAIPNLHSIRKYNGSGVLVSEWNVEGSGDGEFSFDNLLKTHKIAPRIAIDSQGNMYASDTFNHCIQKFTSNGAFIAKWGTFGLGNGQFNSPRGNIALDPNGNIYVSDSYNHRVQKFASNGQFITKWGPGDNNDEFITMSFLLPFSPIREFA